MKNTILLFSLLLASHLGFSQDLSLGMNVGVRKSFELGPKSALDLRQQFQFTPEIRKYRNKYGDFFNEEGFWPVPDRYRDDDELDEDDEEDFPTGAGNGIPQKPGGELNDLPTRIKLDWRSNTSVQYNYGFFAWLRANAGYGLLFDGEEFRHTFRAELNYRPLKHDKKKRKVDVTARTLFQHTGTPDDGVYEWRSLLVPRVDVGWAFKKNHLLQMSHALNGGWEEGIFAFDRWRANLNLVFTYQKDHRFTLSYQFQQRLDKPRRAQGAVFDYEFRF